MGESTTELQRAGTGVKPPLSYVLDFGPALDRIAEVMARGAKKYSRNNWKGGGKNAELAIQLDSVLRHLAARQCGEVYDADMGTDHLANAACGLLFALYHHGKAPAANAAATPVLDAALPPAEKFAQPPAWGLRLRMCQYCQHRELPGSSETCVKCLNAPNKPNFKPAANVLPGPSQTK